MLEALISSKTRIKLLLKFFLNSQRTGYLRSLENEFGESTNAIRLELNRFTEAGLLISKENRNKKIYQANVNHPLFPEINSLLMKYVGIDEIIEKVISKVGQIDLVYLIGDLAKGIDSPLIEIWFIGSNIDEKFLKKLINKTQIIIKRKVKYLIFAKSEIDNKFPELNYSDTLLLWDP